MATLRYAAVALFLLSGPGSAFIAANAATLSDFSEQRLDRIDVISLTKAVNVGRQLDPPSANPPWVATPYTVSGTKFVACQNSARGLYCIDNGSLSGSSIRRWTDPKKSPETSSELFNCSNSALALDRGGNCTALTVDLAGNVWVAGKKNNKYSLFKVVEGSCPSDPANTTASQWKALNSSFCAREYASGRPILIDLSVVDGDVASAFPYPEGGVIGVEERKEVTFFKDSPQATPVSLGSGKVWNLAGGEQLQSASLLQQSTLSRNWVLVTTSLGRLLSREIPFSGPITAAVVSQPVSLVAPSGSISSSCTSATANYDIRASVKTGMVYVSDSVGCRLMSLKPNIDDTDFGSTSALGFSNLQTIAGPTSSFTTDTSTATAVLTSPPDSVSIAPGISLNLKADCGYDGSTAKTCTIIGDGADGNSIAAASLTGVRIVSDASGLTVFQIQNIPDCRYLEYFSEQPAECKNNAILRSDGTPIGLPVVNGADNTADYVVAGTGSAKTYFPKLPERLYLNITPLLPPEVTKIKPLPRMLLSPRYKALSSRRTFDGLFGVTEEGVQFRDKFTGGFDLGDLLGPGVKLGCGLDPSANSTTYTAPTSFSSTDGPQWDVLVTISERWTTVGGPTPPQNVDMLVNTYGCNPDDPTSSGSRWSMYAYGLQLAKEAKLDTGGSYTVTYPDTIFGKLAMSLFNDIGTTINTYLCSGTLDGGSAPVGQPACGNLYANWYNTNDKLTKCVLASLQPKTSSQDQNCQSFETQYLAYKSALDALALSGTDPANRLGEVKSRTEVFRFVYDKQYVPSIPAGGFKDGF
jgi:hypothetical protein